MSPLFCWVANRPSSDPVRRVKAAMSGGARLEPEVGRFFLALGLMIMQGYGQTEAGPVVSANPPDGIRIDTVGRALQGVDVSVAADGEILVRGDLVMDGYWGLPEATAAVIRDGWLHTGDIGEFDDAGNIHIVGRLKDVIRSGSSTIVPKEVEDVITSHPAVAEVAVIGLPDPEWGEAVTAFVVTKPGMSVGENELVEHCRARLAGFKKPRVIRFVASLPRSHYGKVLRAQLIAQATE